MTEEKEEKMRKDLRFKLQDVAKDFDVIRNFSQFTIDWIEELGDIPGDELAPGDNNGALSYDIDTICEVLKDGPDKDFFEMIKLYGKLYLL